MLIITTVEDSIVIDSTALLGEISSVGRKFVTSKLRNYDVRDPMERQIVTHNMLSADVKEAVKDCQMVLESKRRSALSRNINHASLDW